MRTKSTLILAFALAICATMPTGPTFGQAIRSAEYFIDDDPGVGQAMPLAPEDGAWGSQDEGALMDIDIPIRNQISAVSSSLYWTLAEICGDG